MKSHQRTTIEKMLQAGKHKVSTIARMFHVTPQRVSQIKTELTKPTRAEVRELWNVDQVIKTALVQREDFTGWII